jgi:RNase H-like domain found in reverse transcriptase/Chromo (CHRromatin Organisation MOdifier) domain
VLVAPDFSKRFYVSVDASQWGVGAVLWQWNGDERVYVGFASRALRNAQKRYPAWKRELLGLLFALKKWEAWLKGRRFEVESDNRALTYLHGSKSYMIRDWLHCVQGYDFTVTHIPGATNVLPHALSHMYDMLAKEEGEESGEGMLSEMIDVAGNEIRGLWEKEREGEKGGGTPVLEVGGEEEGEREKEEEKEEEEGEEEEEEGEEEVREEDWGVVREGIREIIERIKGEGRWMSVKLGEVRRELYEKWGWLEGRWRELKGVLEEEVSKHREKGEEERSEEEGEEGSEEEEGEERSEEEGEEGGEEEEREEEEGEEGGEGEEGVMEEEDQEEEGEQGEEEGGGGGEGEGEQEEEEGVIQVLGVEGEHWGDVKSRTKRFVREVMGKEEVVDVEERKRLVEEAHERSHQGAEGVFKEIFRGGKYWGSMMEECKRRAGRCRACLKYVVRRRGFHPLRPVNARLPMDFLMWDIAGKMKVSGGYVFVLVIVDVASRYVWLRKMKTKSASEIAGILMEMFCEWGAPAVVRSDNERTLNGLVMERLKEAVGYSLQNAIEYNAEQMGAVERHIREVKLVLYKWCGRRIKVWAKFLPMVQRGINDREVRRTKSAPFCVMFGRRGRRCAGEEEVSGRDDMDMLVQRNKEIFEVVLPSLFELASEEGEKCCKAGDRERGKRNILEKPWKVGTVVVIVNQYRGAKEEEVYEGTFEIVGFDEKKKEYRLKDEEGKEYGRGVPVHDLKVAEWGVEDEREEEGKLYDVEEVRECREWGGRVEYLVKWAGYEEMTWETEEMFVDMEKIREFWRGREGGLGAS